MGDDWFTSLDDLDDIQEKMDKDEAERIQQRRAKRGIGDSERPPRPDFSGMAPGEWLSGDDINDIQDYEDGKSLDELENRGQKRAARQQRHTRGFRGP